MLGVVLECVGLRGWEGRTDSRGRESLAFFQEAVELAELGIGGFLQLRESLAIDVIAVFGENLFNLLAETLDILRACGEIKYYLRQCHGAGVDSCE
jgi:hypothetical protein